MQALYIAFHYRSFAIAKCDQELNGDKASMLDASGKEDPDTDKCMSNIFVWNRRTLTETACNNQF
jgi:hypothetical protein